MSKAINIYKVLDNGTVIEQTKIRRDWMDATGNHHAYKCFPVSLGNTIGISISFPEDITVVWDGITDTTPDHIKFKSGKRFCSTNRGNATVSLNTGLIITTDENTTMLSIVPPNYFIDGIEAYTTLVSTSFYDQIFPIAFRVTRPNVEITIPANTPIVTLIPISLADLNSYEFNILPNDESIFGKSWSEQSAEYGMAAWDMAKLGKFSNFYRDATNHKGEATGSHEVSVIKLKINDSTK